MTQVVIAFLLIAGVSALFKDYWLASSAVVLLLVYLIQWKPMIMLLQKHSFHVGIFFLMMFLLFPLTNEKIDLLALAKELFSPIGLFALLAGFLVSYVGGKGIGVLSTQPVILFGVIIGTLVAVLFFRGLPAGLIIAAGLIAISKYFVST
ncbi:DUF441 family protein [Thermoactinomyces sp. DSM 45892]|uniref:DUF441 family protein n=1 Tax=Thermoactinomyces sp. DSM 45892 TaxID=1882753 RepID=UPI0008988BD5|nr:Uncharacterized membrane protein, DUF441 family [Thermoactinomyces sp. DSM 45892]